MARHHHSFVDIGANLLDEMFQGVYRGKSLHGADLPQVLTRAKLCGAERIICTAGSLVESQRALALARENAGFVKSTVGIHPTQAASLGMDESECFQALLQVARDGMRDGSVVAIGECGLDRDRLEFAPFAVQLHVFQQHFALCKQTNLPMFIHMRNCFEDMYLELAKHADFLRGVVHSFDHENLSDAERLLKLSPNLYIGINGCSLKTEANLQVVRSLPLDRLLVESDAPWCGIRGTSSAAPLLGGETLFPQVAKPERLKTREYAENLLVKTRNEPCNTLDVIRVIAALKQCPEELVASQVLANTHRLFGDM